MKTLLLQVMTGVLLLTSCTRPPELKTSFYYWRTTWSLSQVEANLLAGTTSGRLYLRLFDVAPDLIRGNTPAPVSPLRGMDPRQLPEGMIVVPVVFIVNKSLAGLSPAQARALGGRIAHMAAARMDSLGIPMQELQLDCDWSGSTREAFFALIEGSKAAVNAVITSTIRLHQVRDYKETGIPPVSRGMLMCYNMGDVGSGAEINSILRPSIAAVYLKNMETYPLPLDMALPLFGWGVEERFGKPVRILDQAEISDFRDTSRFDSVGAGRYRVRQSHYLHGTYVYRDAVIRCEYATQDSLLALAAILHPHLQQMGGKHEIAFYHLHPGVETMYGKTWLAKLVGNLQSS